MQIILKMVYFDGTNLSFKVIPTTRSVRIRMFALFAEVSGII